MSNEHNDKLFSPKRISVDELSDLVPLVTYGRTLIRPKRTKDLQTPTFRPKDRLCQQYLRFLVKYGIFLKLAAQKIELLFVPLRRLLLEIVVKLECKKITSIDFKSSTLD